MKGLVKAEYQAMMLARKTADVDSRTRRGAEVRCVDATEVILRVLKETWFQPLEAPRWPEKDSYSN